MFTFMKTRALPAALIGIYADPTGAPENGPQETKAVATIDPEEDAKMADQEEESNFERRMVEEKAMVQLISQLEKKFTEERRQGLMGVVNQTQSRMQRRRKKNKRARSQEDRLSPELMSARQQKLREDIKTFLNTECLIRKIPPIGLDVLVGHGPAKENIKQLLLAPFNNTQESWEKTQKSILLYGAPGIGKTMMLHAISAQATAACYWVSAEKLARSINLKQTITQLFEVAADNYPSIILIDDIDSFLMKSKPGDEKTEIKLELLKQLDTIGEAKKAMVKVCATTNSPWDLDPSAMR